MRKIIWGALLMLCSLNSNACDICGCAPSGSQLGILPQFQKNSIGIRYQYVGFDSRPHDGSNENQQKSAEVFHTTHLWARAVIHKKFNVYAFAPYKINVRSNASGETKLRGMGDAMFLTNFVVFNSSQNEKHKLKHALQVGAGIKLPTGKSDAVQNGLMLHTNLQTGTGSYDIPIELMYTLRYKSIGVNVELNLTKNGINKQHFQFGNRIAASTRFFAWKNVKKFLILPGIGTTCENAKMDMQNNEVQTYTGGNSILCNAGFDIYYKQFGLNLLFQKSVYQNIGDGFITNHPRVMANFIYLF